MAADWFGIFFHQFKWINWFIDSATYDHDNISCVTHLKTNIKTGKSQKWKYETSESKSKYWCQVNPNTSSSTIPFPMLNFDPYWHRAYPPPGLLHLWQCDGADLFTFVPVSTEAVKVLRGLLCIHCLLLSRMVLGIVWVRCASVQTTSQRVNIASN